MSDRVAPELGAGSPLTFAGTWPGIWSTEFTRARAVFAPAIVRPIQRQLELGRGFLWAPILYGSGILIYFGLAEEPSSLVLAAVLSVLGVAAALAGRSAVTQVGLVALAILAAGVAGAKVRTGWVAAPSLTAERTAVVTGWVADRERSGESGARLTILVKSIDKLAPEQTPRVVRVTTRSGAQGIGYGDGISALARVGPPRGPALPGGYDFARADFYQRIGGTGFTLGAPKRVDLGPPPFAISVWAPIEGMRAAIAGRIRSALPGETGAIAEALIVGDQGGISEATATKYRASGLAHILSISGLHMALVAGAVFFVLRAFLALFPVLALTQPIKKWAAVGALLVATLYLGISGAAVATVRSYVMLAVMLGAVVVDRRAATVRNVALAALLILLVQPESIVTASFQMSFAATLAIVAGYEALSGWRDQRRTVQLRRNWVGRAAAPIGGLVLTSLLAGLATTPFVAFHFQRLAPLSLLANVAAGPAVSLIVMPMALAAVVAMPFGLEALPLAGMAYGLDVVNAVNDWVAVRSVGVGEVSMMPPTAFLLAVAGLLWCCLWQGRLRFAGAMPLAAAIALAAFAQRPEILVSAEGTTVAVRGEDGSYRVLGGKGAAFQIGQWLRADGDLRSARDTGLADDTDCDLLGCTAALAGTPDRVALTLDRRGLAEDCRLSAVVVTPLAAPATCRTQTVVIDSAALAVGGAHAVWWNARGGRFRIETAYPPTRRPFMPPVAGSQPQTGAAPVRQAAQ